MSNIAKYIYSALKFGMITVISIVSISNIALASNPSGNMTDNSIEIKIPYQPQEEGPYCGPAALQMVLGAHDIHVLNDGTLVNQNLLSGPDYLNTRNLNYSSGIDICNVLNDFVKNNPYQYELVEDKNTSVLESTVFNSLSNSKIPIFAIWQIGYSNSRLVNYPFGNYELRHFIPITGLTKANSKDKVNILYKDPVYSFSNKFKGEPNELKIDSEVLMDLNIGGSRIN